MRFKDQFSEKEIQEFVEEFSPVYDKILLGMEQEWNSIDCKIKEIQGEKEYDDIKYALNEAKRQMDLLKSDELFQAISQEVTDYYRVVQQMITKIEGMEINFKLKQKENEVRKSLEALHTAQEEVLAYEARLKQAQGAEAPQSKAKLREQEGRQNSFQDNHEKGISEEEK